MHIAIGCDHGGFSYKELLLPFLTQAGHKVEDFGTYSTDSCDYPDLGIKVGEAVASGKADCGIVICGTGIGISISCNKVRGVRCALCGDPVSARLTRAHNDANVLAMGARIIGVEMMYEIVRVFLATPFDGGRHGLRVDKIMKYDSER